MEREMGQVLARLDGINQKLADAEQSRGRMYEKIDATNDKIELTNSKVDKLGWRLDALEQTMNNQAPTIAEFLTYKEQVRGAGRLGKFLWAMGGIILGAAASLASWLNWK